MEEQRLIKIEKEDFDKVFDIMAISFPADEYRDYEQQKALLLNDEYCIYAFEDSLSNNIKAFVAVWDFADFAYVEHLAVHPDYRNGGLGGKMLEAVAGIFNKQICLEVELPDTDLAQRRIGFYRRNGFVLNEYPYIQPPMSKGKNEIPLMIMTSGNKIEEKCFVYYRSMLYDRVYNCGDGKQYIR